METTVNMEAVKALGEALNNPAKVSTQEGRREYVRITWTDRKEVPMHDCWYAFSDDQFKEGLKRFGLVEGYESGEVKIKCGGAGLYGTLEGIKRYWADLAAQTKAQREEIRAKCTPQDVYEVEYNNYECMYDWDGDMRAIGRVLDWFGEDAARSVNRKGYNADIDTIMSRLKSDKIY